MAVLVLRMTGADRLITYILVVPSLSQKFIKNREKNLPI